jgi:cell division protein FtsQ
MARKNAPTISQEELYPLADEPPREEFEDARLLDLEAGEESPFLRGQKRISARRGTLPRKAATHITWAAIFAALAAFCAIGVGALYHYGEGSWRFRIDSSDDIEINGLQNVTRSQVMEMMGGDIGRNIFFVPLSQRKAQLEQIPWVESASIMRFVPNRLRIEIHERTPVAFARVGPKIFLTDAAGTLMELPPKKKYSFPVIVGMSSGEPPSTRAARMKIYNEVLSQLDSGGARYSQELSEVDLSDPDDVKVLANNSAGDVVVHLGSSNYLERYKIYVAHVQEWRQQFQKLESVDLRYDRQIIVNPDLGSAKPVPLSPWAVKRAMAAGVSPAALVTHVSVPGKRATQSSAATAAISRPKPVAKRKRAPHRRAKSGAASVKKTDITIPSKTRAPVIAPGNSVPNSKPSPAIKAQDQAH